MELCIIRKQKLKKVENSPDNATIMQHQNKKKTKRSRKSTNLGMRRRYRKSPNRGSRLRMEVMVVVLGSNEMVMLVQRMIVSERSIQMRRRERRIGK